MSTGNITTELDPHTLDEAIARRAAHAIRSTAARVHATPEDLQTALDCLFAPPTSQLVKTPSAVSKGEQISPADKQHIRELLTAGATTEQITDTVGCSVQAVNGIRVNLTRARRHKATA